MLPAETFFGVGPNSSLEDETTYFNRQLGAELSVDYKANKYMSVGFFSKFNRNDITEGSDDPSIEITEVFDSTTLPGLDRNIRLLENGVYLQSQNLDEPLNPHSGWSTLFSFSTVDSIGGNDFGWLNYEVDTKAYIPLGNKLRVLALRFLGNFKDIKGNSKVPFFRNTFLGGQETLRGYDSFRFQGKNAMHLNAEYRFRLMQGFETSGFTGVEGVFFGDFGQVYNNFDELRWGNVRATWGGGFRITTTKSVIFTMLYAQSPEDNSIIWRFGRSF